MQAYASMMIYSQVSQIFYYLSPRLVYERTVIVSVDFRCIFLNSIHLSFSHLSFLMFYMSLRTHENALIHAAIDTICDQVQNCI